MNDEKNDDLGTTKLCLPWSLYILLMTSQSIADDVTMARNRDISTRKWYLLRWILISLAVIFTAGSIRKWKSTSLTSVCINFIHSIFCWKNESLYWFGYFFLAEIYTGKWLISGRFLHGFIHGLHTVNAIKDTQDITAQWQDIHINKLTVTHYSQR